MLRETLLETGKFLENQFLDEYIQLIETPNINEKTERHHIIPRSLGGTDEDSNLVNLSYQNHFIAHTLLVKIVDGPNRYKMEKAVHIMINTRNGLIFSPEEYAEVRALNSLRTIERNLTRNPMHNPISAKRHNDALRKPNPKNMSVYEVVKNGDKMIFTSMTKIKEYFGLKCNSSIIRAYKKGRPILSGPMAGYMIIRLHSTQIDGPKSIGV